MIGRILSTLGTFIVLVFGLLPELTAAGVFATYLMFLIALINLSR